MGSCAGGASEPLARVRLAQLHRHLFRLANEESMRDRQHENLLIVEVGDSDHTTSPFHERMKPRLRNGRSTTMIGLGAYKLL